MSRVICLFVDDGLKLGRKGAVCVCWVSQPDKLMGSPVFFRKVLIQDLQQMAVKELPSPLSLGDQLIVIA